MQPEQAIERHEQGDLAIMPPTLVTLSEISKSGSYEEVATFYGQRHVRHYNPRVKMQGKGRASFLYEGDSGYLSNSPDIREQLNRCEIHNGVIKHICNLD